MAAVVLADSAVRDLDRMILVLSLPENTRLRFVRTLRILEKFPLLGARLYGRWQSYRFLLGPWRWMVIVYRYDEQLDRVGVVAVFDARSAASPLDG